MLVSLLKTLFCHIHFLKEFEDWKQVVYWEVNPRKWERNKL